MSQKNPTILRSRRTPASNWRLFCLGLLLAAMELTAAPAANEVKAPKQPDPDGLFVPGVPFVYDPVVQDLGDPTILFNHDTGRAWIFYTQRPHWKIEGPGWYHGGPVGMLSSEYNGFSWLYRGTAEGLDGAFEPGRNGFWAPEVIYHGGKYHMYVTFQRGVPLYTGRDAGKYLKDAGDLAADGVLYYTSKDMMRWTFVARLPLEPDNGCVIDPVVHPLRDGTWRMWYRAFRQLPGGGRKAVTSFSDSKDLRHWKHKGYAPDYDCYGEGLYVFHWKGWFWLLIDGMDAKRYGEGLAVFRSKDATTWKHQPERLVNGDKAGHGSVVLQGDRGFLLYQVFEGGMCVGKLAELFQNDGVLTASRDIAPMKLEARKAPCFRGGGAANFSD